MNGMQTAACGPLGPFAGLLASEQRRVWAGRSTYSRRSAPRRDRPALVGLVARRRTRFALRARTDATSQMTKRARPRAAANPAMLGASHARCALPARAFAGTAGRVRLECQSLWRRSKRCQAGMNEGVARSAGSGSARAGALREMTSRVRASAKSAVNAASRAAQPRSGPRSAVRAQRRPPNPERRTLAGVHRPRRVDATRERPRPANGRIGQTVANHAATESINTRRGCEPPEAMK